MQTTMMSYDGRSFNKRAPSVHRHLSEPMTCMVLGHLRSQMLWSIGRVAINTRSITGVNSEFCRGPDTGTSSHACDVLFQYFCITRRMTQGTHASSQFLWEAQSRLILLSL